MAGDPFKHVRAGEPLRFSAAVYNHLVDAARRNLNTARPPAGPLSADNRNPSIVRLRNDSGADQARYAVLGISDALFPPDSNSDFFASPAISGVTPAASHFQKFAVLLQPLTDGDTGWAVVSGVVQCQINVLHAGHLFADVRDGYRDTLESGPWGGARILYQESGTGTKWALVNIGITGGWSYLGKLDFQLNAGNSATVSIWTGSPPSDSGMNVTAYDWFLPSGNIAVGKKVLVEYFPQDKRAYVTAAEC